MILALFASLASAAEPASQPVEMVKTLEAAEAELVAARNALLAACPAGMQILEIARVEDEAPEALRLDFEQKSRTLSELATTLPAKPPAVETVAWDFLPERMTWCQRYGAKLRSFDVYVDRDGGMHLVTADIVEPKTADAASSVLSCVRYDLLYNSVKLSGNGGLRLHFTTP